MKCSECGAKLEKDLKFCGECGAKVEDAPKKKTTKCPGCGAKLSGDEVFCAGCGEKVGTEVAPVASPKVPMDPKKKKIITIVVIALVVVALAYMVIDSLTGPEAVAKSFCKSLTSDNASGIFKIIDLPKSDYLTKEKFESLMESDYSTEIASCKVKEKRTKEKVVQYEITLTNEDDDEYTDTIDIVKAKGKKFLLFDNWLMDGTMFIREEWGITVPEDAILYVDGKEIKSDDVENYNGYDTYYIENVFVGAEYEIKVTHDMFKEYKKMHSSTYSTKIEMDTKGEFKAEVEDFLEALYKNALLAEDFANVEKLIDKDFVNGAKDMAEDVKDTVLYASCFYGECKYKDVKISSVKITNKEAAGKDAIKFKVEFKLAYEYSYDDEDDYTSKSSNYNFNLEITSVGDDWLISNKK